MESSILNDNNNPAYIPVYVPHVVVSAAVVKSVPVLD